MKEVDTDVRSASRSRDHDRSRERDLGGEQAGTDTRIRMATARDARSLNALMAGIYREGRWFVGDVAPGAEALARRIRSADPAAELWLVAHDRSGLSGWVELHRMVPRRMRHVAGLTLAVDAQARGRGIGRGLLRATYPWARRVGVRRIRLDVRAGNDVARRLYESEGFELEGCEREQVRTDEGFEDNLIMARFVDRSEGEEGV